MINIEKIPEYVWNSLKQLGKNSKWEKWCWYCSRNGEFTPENDSLTLQNSDERLAVLRSMFSPSTRRFAPPMVPVLYLMREIDITFCQTRPETIPDSAKMVIEGICFEGIDLHHHQKKENQAEFTISNATLMDMVSENSPLMIFYKHLNCSDLLNKLLLKRSEVELSHKFAILCYEHGFDGIIYPLQPATEGDISDDVAIIWNPTVIREICIPTMETPI
ncbi:MAG: hypothetical protein JW795_15915 [Chitinivibrionales bacterium]|nr:hypothetical protein [Chitinivibrionales bacterium]